MNEVQRKTKLEIKREQLLKIEEQKKQAQQEIKELEKKEERKRNNNNILAFNLAYDGEKAVLNPFLFSGLAKYIEAMSDSEIEGLIEEGKKIIKLSKSGKPILTEKEVIESEQQ